MPLQEHTEKYLAARLKEGSAKPHLHKYTNAIYTHYIHVIETNPAVYAREIGDMFEVMKAIWGPVK